MTNYERVAHAIRYLDEHQAEQPGLDTLAEQAGLSPFHFHRLFTAWAGVTPKDFLQCLTLRHARDLLRHGDNVLDAALDAGLSGPGRLHDLCVTLDAASPGEWKTGGAGWNISAGFAMTPFGRCLVAESPRGICHLAFLDDADGSTAWRELEEGWPEARLRRNDSAALKLARQIFTTAGTARPSLRAFVRGTAFQVRVWRALLEVPAGRVVSYGYIARAVGSPDATRAVGAAVGRNPIGWLIPCHRVIRETGVIGGYRWGRIRKRALLAWEAARVPACAARDDLTLTPPRRLSR
jgi:AraC family transcriptional regulator of adaptative response/methylated-DNA-[protein]-cysteine methyltransferase